MNPNLTFSALIVDELARVGLREVCIAPGSRSTPLALAFAAHPAIRVYLHLDERSAAFFAMGLAMGSGRPAAVLCTSGSAAANFFPAIIEARMSRLPLLVLTADRPHELRGSGANQTIDQIKLYGDQVLWSVDLPLPEAGPSELVQRSLRALAARAYAVADGIVKGPVHLNFPFRKPLEPEPGEGLPEYGWEDSAPPQARLLRGQVAPDAGQARELGELIAAHRRGLIVCGPGCPGGDFPAAVSELARRSGYPLLADPLSGLRFGCAGSLGGYEAYMGRPELRERLLGDTELVLRFGGVPTSTALMNGLDALRPRHRLHIVEHGVWQDDTHRTDLFLQADPALACRALLAFLPEREESAWARRLQEAERRYWEALQAAGRERPMSDGLAAAETLAALPEGARLWAGNSLPVRHLDAYAPPSGRRIQVFGSRGASGIDGNISTALGVAACDPECPLAALVGDLTFYHDMNGLFALRRHNLGRVTIVLLNNNGGGIFRRLPVSAWDPPFEELFLTPHGLDFRYAAGLYGLEYRLAEDRAALRRALQERLGAGTPGLVEVRTDSAADLHQHRELMDQAAAAVAAGLL